MHKTVTADLPTPPAVPFAKVVERVRRFTLTCQLCRSSRRTHTPLRSNSPRFCRHWHRLQVSAEAGSFRRRSRKYGDGLLDNVDGNRSDPRLNTTHTSGRHTTATQPAAHIEPAASPSASYRRKAVIQSPQAPAGSRRDNSTDDWGWGYTGPTLATIAGDYEEELRATATKSTASSAQQRAAQLDDNWHQQDDMQDWEDEEGFSDDDSPEESPDVTLLDSSEVDQLLKVAPQTQQIQYYGGTPVDLGVRVGTGLVLTLAASKVPLLAAGTLFYPLWWPIYKAWSQNQKLRSQYRYAGLWRTTLLGLQAEQQPGGLRLNAEPSSMTFLLGNESSARTEISVPFNRRYEDVQVGEAAELLLLSNTPDFSSFKALKEAYLPESGIWVAKYPFVDRDVFLDISLDVARADQGLS